MNHNHLSIETIRSMLGNNPWSGNIQVFDEVISTNTLLKELAAKGIPHGTVIIADRQTGGRGRMGRQFLSPGGMGIYLSALIRPNVAPSDLMHLTCAVACAMCDAVETVCGVRPGIKWTNDLVFGTKKSGGILTELGLDAKTGNVSYAILGIGINCCQTEEDFDPTIRNMACSLKMATGQAADRNVLAAEVIRALHRMNDTLLPEKAAMLERYRRDCITLGKQISVVRGDEIRHGTALDINDSGALVVSYADGTTGIVSSGEVSIRGLYGYV